MVHQRKQFLRFRGAEGSRRLVQNQKITGALYSSGNQHKLLLGQGQFANLLVFVNIDTQPLQCLPGCRTDVLPVYGHLPFHTGDQLIHHDILCHSLGREQGHIHFLIDDLNAQLLRDTGIAQLHYVSVQQDLSGVAGIRSRQNLHQRGFSRAVGTYHRPDIACFNREVHIRKCFHTGKLYGYVPGFNSFFSMDSLPFHIYKSINGKRLGLRYAPQRSS